MLRLMWLTVASTLAVATQAQVVQYADLERVAQLPAVIAFEARLAAAVRANDHAALLDLALATDSAAMAPMVREHLRVALANHLAGLAPTPAMTQWLRSLASTQVEIQVAHEHDGHTTTVPAWDPGAAARHALAKHAHQNKVAELRALIETGRGIGRALGAVSLSKSKAPVKAEIFADAVRGLDHSVLAHEIDGLVAQLEGQPELGAAMIEAARQLKRPSLLNHVVARGRARDVREALAVASSIDASFDPLPMIRAAIARPDSASAGLQALARAGVDDASLTRELLGYLQQPNVARAAAAAIAAYADPALVPHLARELAATNDADYGRALALALSLMPQPQARAALLAWSKHDGPLRALRVKIRMAYAEAAQ